MEQLIACKSIDKIVVSTDDPIVAKICERYIDTCEVEVVIDPRPENLAASSTSTDDLIQYVPNIIPNGHVLWTHVTSPFVNTNIYSDAIHKYYESIDSDEYDSLMSVTSIQKFLWNADGPYNYDQNVEKWPRTQTLEKLFEVNSAFFITSVENYLKNQNRIGDKVYLYTLSPYQAFDIDWEDDFRLAEMIWDNKKNG